MSSAVRNECINVPVSDFDPYAEDVLLNPYPYYEQLRELGPVVYLERYGAYAVARHDEVRSVLFDPATYCSSAGVGLANFLTEKPWRAPSIILEADPPEHARTRKVVARVLSPASIARLRPVFEQQAEILVDSIIQKGEIDAASDFCEAYPIKVFADAVGLPSEGRHNLLPYGDMVFNGFGPINERFKSRLAKAQEAVSWINNICRRENLTPDGLGADLYAAADAGEITHEEAGMLVRTLLSAGLDTTAFTLCNTIVAFANNPDQFEILKADPSLARHAIEEVVRYDPTFHSFYRTTTKPVQLAGVDLDKHQKIVVFIGSANRDPRKWDNPDKFDLNRKTMGHMGFGAGIHGCAGQMMARLEGEILLGAFARKVKTVELTGELVRHFNNTVRGLKSIPARVTGH